MRLIMSTVRFMCQKKTEEDVPQENLRGTYCNVGKEDLFLVLQFLEDANLTETARILEEESGIFFNMSYFENIVTNGDWDKVERYLLAFTGINDNTNSTKIFYEIRRRKCLEALDIDHKLLSDYGDRESARATMFADVKNFIEENRLLL
ncbi:topless-related 1-like [Olea europaea subsp. europaea]|uniref:Topless-related 1-like n=1 Tax=Olea europaea subsp. europaea TaxID=158383 RepID=A0A8S0UR54_OLEEU|nr:topless-related 1-like [Olea europaea subsp. europaea]